MKKSIDSITTWILFPFLSLIAISFGFSIWISRLDIQRIVDNTFEEFSNEINNRVKEKITIYFSMPHLINKINSDAIELNQLVFDKKSSKQSQRYLTKQLISFRSNFADFDRLINAIYYATPEKEFWSAEYNSNDKVIVSLRSNLNSKGMERYSVEQETGEILENFIRDNNEYNPEQRPWYIVAKSGKAWSPIYKDNSTDELVITAVKQVLGEKSKAGIPELKGVLGVDLLLSEIETFLKEVVKDIDDKGLIFIAEPNPRSSTYNLIVTSQGHDTEHPYSPDRNDNRDFRLVIASQLDQQNSENDSLSLKLKKSAKLISGIAKKFKPNDKGKCPDLDNTKSDLYLDNKRYLVKTFNLEVDRRIGREAEGLNWCIFWTIPESQLLKNTDSDVSVRQTSWGIYTFLGFILTSGAIFAANKIVKPIKKLTDSVQFLSRSISNDILPPSPDVTRPSELSILSDHFNTMGQDLIKAFSELKFSKKELENSKKQTEIANLELEQTNLELQKTNLELERANEDSERANIQLEKANTELEKVNRDSEKANAKLEKTNEAFKRFVPQNFSNLLGKQIIDIQLGDSIKRTMTIFFSDIRSFTSLSEEMKKPKENFDFINSYLNKMESAITEHHGFIDKYIGDAIMALFDHEDEARTSESAKDAIEAALSMLERLVEYNQEREQNLNLNPIQIGIGIHLGDLRLGTVGGQNRMDTTVISPAVNLTSRLEGLTKKFGAQILISENAFKSMKTAQRNQYAYRYLGPVKPKGLQDMVRIYEICDANLPEIRACKMAHKAKFTKGIDLYIACQFSQASLKFKEILEACPNDRAARFYLDCCENKRDFNEEFGK